MTPVVALARHNNPVVALARHNNPVVALARHINLNGALGMTRTCARGLGNPRSIP